ncbi:MAG: transcription antitermination factor NusB [Gammaproteobacteria bacterium]|nr:transcription antitermination factor NusB [Gammaproteobacteria bacterium]MCY4357580.1 transcription antitermination factor NusB [Gammaproteobacteria bacterium]
MGTRIPVAQRRRARQLIMQALYQWFMSRMEPAEISKQFHADNPGKIDWDYFDDIFTNVPIQAKQLVASFQPLLDREVSAIDPVEKALLYLGTYELSYRIDVPYRVVINECVELAKNYGATDSHKYINGVLDKLVPKLRMEEHAGST